MARNAEERVERLLDASVPLCLALALVILSLTGVGNVRVASLAGLFLCGAGLTRDAARADWKLLLPLLVYDAAAMASAYGAYGNLVDGYGVLHALFPVLYLLTACLDARERRLLRDCCVLWAGAAAAAGIGRFVFQAVQGGAGRLSSPLGNPNAMGIFLVVSWFVLLHCGEEEAEQSRAARLEWLEPLLLIALALTLSMGSFAAMAAGIAVLLLEKKRGASWRETFRYACRLLARASLGMGTGLLLYLAAARTGVPWLCLPLLAYGAAEAVCWRTFRRFLEAYPRTAAWLAAMGVLVAAAAVAVRPSAAATFAERLEMMASGLRYLTADPLLGVGPFQWRLLDLNDGGKYFNTWHIHNVPLHIGVEMGWLAMAMAVLAGLRALCRKKPPLLRAGTAAFLFHNLIDTSFFYLGITALAVTAAGGPESDGKPLGGGAVKLLFAVFACLFAYSLYYSLR